MRVRNHMQQLARHHVADLRHHHQQNGVLAHIPVIGRQHVLGALVQHHIEYQLLLARPLGHIIGNAVSAGVQMHLTQIRKYISIRHNPTAVGILLQIEKHPIHLIHIALLVMTLHADLVTIGLADGSGLIGPLVPDMTVQVVDVVGLLLVNPEDLVHTAFKPRPSKRQRRKPLRQIITVHHAKLLNRIGRSSVLPFRTHLLPLGAGAVLDDVPAHLFKYLICITHAVSSSLSLSSGITLSES